MVKAKKGDTVKVEYTGKLINGDVFDSSRERPPLEFKIGDGKVIPGFKDAVLGMEPGESKTVEIPVEDGYGAHKKELVFEVNRNQLPDDLKLEKGLQLHLQQPDGRIVVVVVSAVGDSTVKLDANHPLAGKKLIFDLMLLDVIS